MCKYAPLTKSFFVFQLLQYTPQFYNEELIIKMHDLKQLFKQVDTIALTKLTLQVKCIEEVQNQENANLLFFLA